MVGIAATTTYADLKVTAVLDQDDYPTGTEISDERIRYLQDLILDRYTVHGEWNYAVRSVPYSRGPATPARDHRHIRRGRLTLG